LFLVVPNTERVLIVDDHADTAEVLSVMFRMLGHQTRAVVRGRHALPAARELDPTLILVDLGLPDVNGYEVLHALRAISPEPFIAAVTGWDREQDVARSMQAGFDTHVAKPIDMGKVRLLLRLAAASRAHTPS
jgi:DNA-binding response OmpR family regulator